MRALEAANELLGEIEDLGYEAYIVGGYPRDVLRGVSSSDIDIATNCPIPVLSDKFETYEIGRGKEFGVVLVRYRGYNHEVVQFRTESEYDRNRPKKIEIVKSLEEDVSRRDFTMNAIAMNGKGDFIDYVNGIEDLANKVIRAVGDPDVRFQEDPVRMIRAARFASIDGFKIETYTRRSIRRRFRLINNVTPERVGLELIKVAKKPGPQFAKFILILDDLKVLGQILPEVVTMKYFRHDLEHHPEGPTVFDHTLKCLSIMEDAPAISKMATLLHDVGKCVSWDEEKYGWKMSYPRHERTGAEMAVDILERYKFSSKDVESVYFAVLNHMKFHHMLEMKPSKIARLVNHPCFPILEDVAWADEFSRGETFSHHGDFDNKIKRAYEIKEKWENRIVNSTIKIVDGKRVMKLLNLKPCPEVGRIKKLVEEYIIDNDLEPTEEVIEKLILKHGGK